ncbi:hypothetical protein NliqN6_0303 [Naganishia liquefaciens]|uniref:Uncharacterized protein n=1 Tax=Naganishia liquefaciens TaxID=104408 RepID=A0A8H3TNC3_9TREE|nr:hypothetical protein NliqN6_0303 [Naganishia liquefaciens]
MDAPRTAERKRRGRMVDYIDSLPTPPSTKNNRSRRHHAHHDSSVGLPTPSTSARKATGSQQARDLSASPINKSRCVGVDGVDLEAEAEAENALSETTQGGIAVMEKRWMGRRGSRRPGLTFAQQMGLLISRPGDQHSQSFTRGLQSDWRPSGFTNEGSDAVVEKSFYFNASSISARERSEVKLSVPTTVSIQENPFLDDADRPSANRLQKTASGRLLDPVDVISPEASMRKPDSTVQDAGSETELEQDAFENEEDEEEDDSPYLIESSDPFPVSDSTFQAVRDVSAIAAAAEDSTEELDSSDLSEISDVDTDAENERTVDNQDEELEEGPLSVDLAPNESMMAAVNGGKRLHSISASFTASKGSSSDLARTSPTTRNSSIRPKKLRERKTWSKPILGDTEDNPFLASSTAGNPKSQGFAVEAGGSWLRTDNARTRRSEGEKPTIDYLFRGQKTTFANPYYMHDPYRPPATSLLPPEHPEFSPAPVPAPRMLFPQAATAEDNASDDEGKAVLRRGRRDILPGRMPSSPIAQPSAIPATRALQRRISSQIPPLARQGSTILEKAQRAQAQPRPAVSQSTSRPQNGTQKRSMDAVLGGVTDGNDDEDELLLRNPRAGRRLLFGPGAGGPGRVHSDQQQHDHAAGMSSNKKVKMEHVMGE